MARITNEQADQYYGGSNSEWFQLKNDGDVARVQFMFDSLEDIPTYATHRIKLGDKERQVDCLRLPNEPVEKCPLCAAGIKCSASRFIIMYQHDDKKVKIWERGRQFISKIQGLINRYSPLSEHVFEVERHGRPGDTSTKYEIYPLDGVEVVDVSEMEQPELEGGIILEKSFEEMEYYLDHGDFPQTGDGDQNPPVRRGAPAASCATTPARRTAAAGTATPSRRGTPAASQPSTPPSRASRRNAGGNGSEVF